MDNGYNPLRWRCAEKGCHNELLRPRIEEFAECLPGRIAFSDIDGCVEVAGRFLFLEWKAPGGTVSRGQQIMHARLTELSGAITVIIVAGNPQTMEVQAVQVVHNGRAGAREPCDLAGLKARVAAWARRSAGQRAHRTPA